MAFKILGPMERIFIDQQQQVHIAKKLRTGRQLAEEILDIRLFIRDKNGKGGYYTKKGVCIPWDLAKVFDAAFHHFKEAHKI